MVGVQKKVFFSIIPLGCYVVFACRSLWKVLQQLFFIRAYYLHTLSVGCVQSFQFVAIRTLRNGRTSNFRDVDLITCVCLLRVNYNALIQYDEEPTKLYDATIFRVCGTLYMNVLSGNEYKQSFWCRRQSIRIALELFAEPSSN